MENIDLTNASMNDIVFQNRNKSFGAYILRKDHNRYALIAMLVAVALFTLALYSPDIFALFSKNKNQDEDKEMIVEAVLEDVPLDEKTPEPPPMEIEPPKVDMIRFLPPEIKPDEEVKKDDIPPTQEELDDKTNIGDKTQEGDTVLVIEETGNGNQVVDDAADDKMYEYVEEQAEYPGGNGELTKFLVKHLVYPKKAEKMEIQGTVYVYFEIDREGKISNVKVKKGTPSDDLNEEAVRVVKMMPNWKPGKMNGRSVKSPRIIPVKFKLPD